MMEENRFARFSLLLNSAAKSIQRLKTQYMERYALSAAHTNCLCRLLAAGEEGLTQSRLAVLEQMDRAQVCRVLRELQDKGYVVTEGRSSYKRSYRLSAEGQVVARQIDAVIERILRFVGGDIPPADLEAFYRTLQTITDNLTAVLSVGTADLSGEGGAFTVPGAGPQTPSPDRR